MPLIRRDFLRSGLALGLAAALPLTLGGAGQAPPRRRIYFTAEERAVLAQIDAYFNGLKAMRSSFVQFGPQGQVDHGTLWLKRPGRARFEYQPPNPVLIVANGESVAVANRQLKTVDTYPLSATPLDMLLNGTMELRQTSAVLAVVMEPGMVTVRARTGNNRNTPNLDIVFARPQIELRQWRVTDAQGGDTTVVLNGLAKVADLPDDLFVLPKKSDFAKTKR